MEQEERADWQDDEVNLLDYWRVLKKRSRMILVLTGLSVFATRFLSYFVMTKIHESKASVLAPKESGGGGTGLAAALAASGLRQFVEGILPPPASNRDAFVAILKSRTIAQDLLERFNLKAYYRKKYTEDAIKKLQDMTEIKVSKEGVTNQSI